jgi:hypothetical protein
VKSVGTAVPEVKFDFIVLSSIVSSRELDSPPVQPAVIVTA